MGRNFGFAGEVYNPLESAAAVTTAVANFWLWSSTETLVEFMVQWPATKPSKNYFRVMGYFKHSISDRTFLKKRFFIIDN